MPCASFPWVYASLATWCTAPISRTILAVEALRLVKKERGRPARPTRERGRLARTKTGTMEENPVKAGLVRLAREWPWMAGCLQE